MVLVPLYRFATDRICFVLAISSITATFARNELSLIVVITWLNNVGMIVRNACGNTMYHMICTIENPCDLPASICPGATEFKPPRTISAITPEVYRINATDALNNSLLFTEDSPNICRSINFGLGQNTRQIKIQNSSGVFRNNSI